MLTYNNTIIDILDGGLGNKFNGLFQGIHLHKKLNKNLVINNVRNHSSDCNLKLLFDFDYEYIENTITELDNKLDLNIPIYLHKKHLNYKRRVIVNNNNYVDPTFVFLTDSLGVSGDILKECYKSVKITQSILDQVSKFVQQHNITKETLSLHIRGSDSPNRDENIRTSLDFISKNKDKQFFICTDEKSIEDQLRGNPNLVFYKKTSYTEKYDKSAGWNGAIVDNDNRRWNYNAARNEQSIVEAFIEMLILSKTTCCSNNRSTFLAWSKRFGESGLL